MIKLCYKEYEWKLTNGARKSFHEQTGLDLEYFFGDYIDASIGKEDLPVFTRMQLLAKLHSKELVAKALHAIIKAANDGVPLAEIQDAMDRVSWILSDRPDDLSEPWPFVMLSAALEINDYYNQNIPKKKAGTEIGELSESL